MIEIDWGDGDFGPRNLTFRIKIYATVFESDIWLTPSNEFGIGINGGKRLCWRQI